MLPKVHVQKVHTYTGHKDAVYSIEPGREPYQFYSAGGDGQVVQWDLRDFETGRLIAKVPTSVYALHYWREKDVLIVGQNYEGIHLIDLSDLSEKGSLKLSGAAIFDIKTHGDLGFIATGDGELFIVDMVHLKIVKRSMIAEKNLRTLLITSEDKCLVGTSDGHIIEIDIKTLKILNETLAHENSVFALAQYSNESHIISGSRDARLKYWEPNPLELAEPINAHMYAINDITFHPDGEYFATASMDKTIKIWDYQQRRLIKVIDKARHNGHLTSVNKLLWTKYNEYLISCSDDRSIGVWKLDIRK